ncbi:FAD linked oxidase protein, partial [Teladorsagia circumcincta]
IHEIFNLRHGKFPRLPDIVVWPRSEEDVIKIIELAMNKHCAIIPIGGGTSVSSALECPVAEQRTVISMDMALMDKIIWIDKDNLTCRAQNQWILATSWIGQSMLHPLQFLAPNDKYGNIEDLVIHINFATSKGMIYKQCQVPRISSGPDLHHVIMGSEGTLGVVTEVTIKVFPLPEVKRYGSLVFPDFNHGVAFFREVARQMEQICAATCIFEGTADQVYHAEKTLYALAQKYEGVDLGMEYGVLGESFETSAPWDKVLNLCRNVKELIKRKSKEIGIKWAIVSCRIPQIYDAGACVYFYFGFSSRGLSNPLEVYDQIEVAARDEIIACGGSISHHHGVGKSRKQWMPRAQGAVGMSLLKAIKVIDLAMITNCAIIPIGGGTSVSSGLECPVTEERAVISMDMTLMDKIIWIDKENLTCRVQ